MTFKQAWNRRSFLSMMGAVGIGAASPRRSWGTALSGPPAETGGGYDVWPDGNFDQTVVMSGFGSSGNPWAELGVKPMINAAGTLTVIGGSLIPPEVEQVMRMGTNHFVVVDSLERNAGKRMAEMLKFPAGYSGLVTAGAAAALLAGWAGILTGDNPEWIKQIPDLTGMPKTEVVIQRSHRYPFDHQIRQTGVKLVEVESRQDLLNAIGPQTAGMHFLNLANPRGQIKVDEWVKIAHAHNLPAFNDAAADTPPISRLWEYVHMGYDLVTFSGGKDIRGPQCAGLLFGRQQLLDYAQINMSPHEDTIARPCKVGKEEIFGMLKALELFVGSDQPKLARSYKARLEVIAAAARKFPGVTTRIAMGRDTIANVTPGLTVTWDPEKVKLSSEEAVTQFKATEPMGIILGGGGGGRSHGNTSPVPAPSLNISCWQLKPGEERIIAQRLTDIFKSAVV